MYTARVGFFIAPDELIEPFRVLLQHTLLTVNHFVQYACIKALNHLEEVEMLKILYKERNEYTVKKLADVKDIRILKAQRDSIWSYFVMTSWKKEF